MSSDTDDDKVDLFRANTPDIEAMLSNCALLPAIKQKNIEHLSKCLKRGPCLSMREQ